MTEPRNLAELIDFSAEKYGPRPLFGTKVNGEWQWISYADFQKKVERLRAAFHEMGLKSGDVVAIIAGNSLPFALTVYASYGLGASIVPMYEVQKQDDWNYIIQDSRARFVFTGNDEIRTKILDMNIESVDKVISYKPSIHDAQNDIEAMIDAHPEGMKRIEIDETSIADILYTSGTTGKPKGVELTHQNIVQNSIYTYAGFNADCNDRSLSFLPWAHAFGKTVELHIFPYFGASIALAESIKNLQQNIVETHPTIIVGVPKIFNKFHDKIIQNASQNPVIKALFKRLDLLSIKSRHQKLSLVESAQKKLLQQLIAPKIHKAFGGKIRFCISGGAPLATDIIHFFDNFKILITEGYGMTETSPIIAVNKHGHVKFGSVGRVLDCNKVRIEPVDDTEDSKVGEVIVGGPCVMKQYHNAPEITKEVLTDDHELHTGDLGYIDEDGFLFLTGRVKEQYKLENGKYVVPGALEEKLNTSTAIEHAVIFGAGRPYNIALIKPTEEFLEQFKKDNHLEDASLEALEDNPDLTSKLMEEVKVVTKEFRGYEKPEKIAVILGDISIQNGFLTPALKLKRHVFEKHYKERINSLY